MFGDTARYAGERGLGQASRDQLRHTLSAFAKFLGHDPECADFVDATVNLWLATFATTHARDTVRTQRGNLLTYWRWLAEEGFVDEGPKRIKRLPRQSAQAPEAWHLDGLARLLTVADATRGHFKRSRVHKGAFWRAFILGAYSTGLRLGDLLALRLDAIAADGAALVQQHKTGSAVRCRLSVDARTALRLTMPPARELAYGGALSRRELQRQFRELLLRAGLPGSVKWLRRSGATWLEVEHPGTAWRFLGHTSPRIAYAHYVDPQHQPSRLPPPIHNGHGKLAFRPG